MLLRDMSNNNVISGRKQWMVYIEDVKILKCEALFSSYRHKKFRSHNTYYCL